LATVKKTILRQARIYSGENCLSPYPSPCNDASNDYIVTELTYDVCDNDFHRLKTCPNSSR